MAVQAGEAVLFDLEQDVAVITMNDPARRNALGRVMRDGLMDAFRRAGGARAVVLRAGAGAPVWCAGFDIGELAPGVDPLAQGGALQALFRAVAECPAPVIAMLDGTAWGGGADLAVAVRHRDRQPGVHAGVHPGAAGVAV